MKKSDTLQKVTTYEKKWHSIEKSDTLQKKVTFYEKKWHPKGVTSRIWNLKWFYSDTLRKQATP